MKIVAMVPMKLNNERLPGKNTKLLGGKPLCFYQLDALARVKGIDEIYVYCSDPSIVEYLPQGITFLQRPRSLDLPTSNFTQIFDSFMSEVDADIYVFDHVTAPFISVNTIEECKNEVISGRHDSAFCAVKIQDFLWKDCAPLNFDATNLPRSQDIEPIYRETSGVYVFRKKVFCQLRRRIGTNPYIKEVSFKESIDINNPEDFRLAEAMLNVEI